MIMKYSKQEVIQYVQEEDVKFIRLSFCDVFALLNMVLLLMPLPSPVLVMKPIPIYYSTLKQTPL